MTFCWHHYTAWSKPVVTNDGVCVQQRYCTKCNKCQIRTA